jgi:superfamily I DNA and/or RNA helicase
MESQATLSSGELAPLPYHRSLVSDERDIIILSICYGPGPDGRMLMNFGPIKQRGGEKRLNVIFSRARHHIAVVSSIRHQASTNDYNDGAAALKGFLVRGAHVQR